MEKRRTEYAWKDYRNRVEESKSGKEPHEQCEGKYEGAPRENGSLHRVFQYAGIWLRCNTCPFPIVNLKVSLRSRLHKKQSKEEGEETRKETNTGMKT
jgi:hypothetical protein